MFYLITKIRSNTKNTLMSLSDKIILRKRAVMELVIDELKSIRKTVNTLTFNGVAQSSGTWGKTEI